jgi:VWFA-related protein
MSNLSQVKHPSSGMRKGAGGPHRSPLISARAVLLALFFCLICAALLGSAAPSAAQSGRNVAPGRRTTVLHVIARRADDPARPRRLLTTSANPETEAIITKHQLELFDGGVLQEIDAFALDPSPARIVVLMDNSATLQADVKKLATVPAAFAPEIYEGDKVMVIGYDLKPEVITDFTDEPKELQNTLSLLRKTDAPHLFDALNVVMEDVLRPEVGFSKRVIVLVSDGLDRGSQIKFEPMLAKLQDENVTVYVIQIRDRTRGALRRDAPKPEHALEALAEATGGKIYPLDGDIKQTVKEICDELRNDRYQLTYSPAGINRLNKRRLLLTSSDAAISLRFKAYHPPQAQQ